MNCPMSYVFPQIWGRTMLTAFELDIQEEKVRMVDEEIEESSFPTRKCVDLDKWETTTDSLWNKILGDMDFEDPTFSSLTPDLRAAANINPGYFTRYNGAAQGAPSRGQGEVTHPCVCYHTQPKCAVISFGDE